MIGSIRRLCLTGPRVVLAQLKITLRPSVLQIPMLGDLRLRLSAHVKCFGALFFAQPELWLRHPSPSAPEWNCLTDVTSIDVFDVDLLHPRPSSTSSLCLSCLLSSACLRLSGNQVRVTVGKGPFHRSCGSHTRNRLTLETFSTEEPRMSAERERRRDYSRP